MEITLKINEEDKTFVQEFVPMKFYRKALEIEKYARSEEMDEEEVLDKRLNLVVDLFDKQFTKDEIENGLNVINHADVLYNIIGVGVLGYRPIEEQEEVGKFLTELQESESPSKNESTK